MQALASLSKLMTEAPDIEMAILGEIRLPVRDWLLSHGGR